MWTLPLKRAAIGPIFTAAVAFSSVSETRSRDWQPGMLARSTSGSFSASHTRCRGAGMRRSPVISIHRFSLAGPRFSGRFPPTQRAAPLFRRVRLGYGERAGAERGRRAARERAMTYLLADDVPEAPAGRRFRELLARGGIVPIPGAHNGLAALQARAAGFEAVYLSGAAMTASMGLPDLGVITLDEAAFFVRQV